jgi:hypothetical protein
MAARGDHAALEVNVDIVPMREAVENLLLRLGIGTFQIAQGLVGEHHAPTECVIGAVALDHSDLVRRIAPLHLDRKV